MRKRIGSKKKLAIKLCEFFVSGYKMGTDESVITRWHSMPTTGIAWDAFLNNTMPLN